MSGVLGFGADFAFGFGAVAGFDFAVALRGVSGADLGLTRGDFALDAEVDAASTFAAPDAALELGAGVGALRLSSLRSRSSCSRSEAGLVVEAATSGTAPPAP